MERSRVLTGPTGGGEPHTQFMGRNKEPLTRGGSDNVLIILKLGALPVAIYLED